MTAFEPIANGRMRVRMKDGAEVVASRRGGRLIRARLVLGQREQAKRDLQQAQSLFADDAETLSLFQPLAIELSEPQ